MNIATLDAVIEVPANSFQESGISFGTSVFLFDLNKPHKDTDKVLYYDFTDTGYEYYKDSGLVDKYGTFDEKKRKALENIANKGQYDRENTRTWTTFYDIPEVNNFEVTLNTRKISTQDIEETDLTKANQEIKLILKEKQELIDDVGNKIPVTEEFEEYLINLISDVKVIQ